MSVEPAVDLRHIPFLASLEPQALAYIQARLVRQQCLAGEQLALPGERQDRLVIIESGRVELLSPSGQKQVVGAGQAFGEAMLRYGVPSAFVAQAATPCSVWVLERQDWLVARELAATPELSETRPVAVPADLAETRPVAVQIDVAGQAAPVDQSEVDRVPVSAHRRLRPSGCVLLLLALVCVAGLVAYFLGSDLVALGSTGLSNRALDAGRPDLAITGLRLGLVLQPDSADLNDALGVVLFSQGELQPAQAALARAVELDDELASARNNLGVVLLALNRPAEAIPHLEAAEALNPGSVEAHLNLGNACLAADDLDCAARSYQHAFDLDPTQAQARALWAAVALRQGHTEQARAAWQQAAELAPDLFLAQRGLGAVAVLDGRLAEALPALQAALVAQPSDPQARLYLALALEGLGRPDEAAAEFKHVLALTQDPDVTALAQAHLLALLQQRSPGSGN